MPDHAPTPSVGRIVHYVSHGTPIRADGSQAFTAQCRAAIVTEVTKVPIYGSGPETPDVLIVGLCVLNPTGQFFNRGVEQDEVHHGGGTWHWPEQV